MIDTIGGEAMNTARVFKTGRSQAVRLPREFRFDVDEVAVNKVNDVVVLFPRRKGWDVLARALGQFTEDFLADRRQPRRSDARKPL
jgi:antitoxin VapB